MRGRSATSASGRYIRSLVRGLAEADTDNRYLLLVGPNGRESAADRCRRTSSSSRNRHRSTACASWRCLSWRLCRLSSTSTMPPTTCCRLVPAAPWSRSTTSSTCSTPSSSPPRLAFFYAHRMIRRSLARGAASSPSRTTPRSDLLRYFDVDGRKIEVVYNGVDPIFRQRLSAGGPRPLARAASTCPRDTCSSSATRQAAQEPGHRRPGLRLGRSSMRELRGAAGLRRRAAAEADLKIRQRAEQLGRRRPRPPARHVAEEALPAIYQGATLFLYPTLYEGFGLPVVEAMASGVPVITSNTSALKEIGEGYAHLVNPLDLDAMARAIAQLMADPDRRESLAQNGPRRAEDFSVAAHGPDARSRSTASALRGGATTLAPTAGGKDGAQRRRAPPSVRTALVHDWLTGMRGGEKVLEAGRPASSRGADPYAVPFPGQRLGALESHPIHTSFLQRAPGAEAALPALPATLPRRHRGLRPRRLRPGDQHQPLRRQGGDPGAGRRPPLLLLLADALCVGPGARLLPAPPGRWRACAAWRSSRLRTWDAAVVTPRRPLRHHLALRRRAHPPLLRPRGGDPPPAGRHRPFHPPGASGPRPDLLTSWRWPGGSPPTSASTSRSPPATGSASSCGRRRAAREATRLRRLAGAHTRVLGRVGERGAARPLPRRPLLPSAGGRGLRHRHRRGARLRHPGGRPRPGRRARHRRGRRARRALRCRRRRRSARRPRLTSSGGFASICRTFAGEPRSSRRPDSARFRSLLRDRPAHTGERPALIQQRHRIRAAPYLAGDLGATLLAFLAAWFLRFETDIIPLTKACRTSSATSSCCRRAGDLAGGLLLPRPLSGAPQAQPGRRAADGARGGAARRHPAVGLQRLVPARRLPAPRHLRALHVQPLVHGPVRDRDLVFVGAGAHGDPPPARAAAAARPQPAAHPGRRRRRAGPRDRGSCCCTGSSASRWWASSTTTRARPAPHRRRAGDRRASTRSSASSPTRRSTPSTSRCRSRRTARCCAPCSGWARSASRSSWSPTSCSTRPSRRRSRTSTARR